MDLTEPEIEQLSRFFAKRFPAFEQRIALASQVGLGGVAQVSGEPLRAWRDLVRLASEAGRLPALTHAAGKRLPDDLNLQDLQISVQRGVYRPRFRIHGWHVITVAALLGTFSLGLLVGRCSSPDTPVSAQAQVGTPSSSNPASPEPTGSAVVEPVAAEPAVVPTAEPTPGKPSSKWSSKDLSVLGALAPGEEVDTTEVDRTVKGRCGGPGGQIVGYWYTDKSLGVQRGQTYLVKTSMNVRQGTPTSANGWRSTGPVACTLKTGDRVLLRSEPVRTPGNHYWIPVHAGDIVSPTP